MQLKSVWAELDDRGRKALARRAKTTVFYLRKLAGGHGMPSMEMAQRLIAAEPRLTFDGFLQARKEKLKRGVVPRGPRRQAVAHV